MATIKQGEYISKDLSGALLDYITRKDLTEIHAETGVSASTLNQIRHMQNVVTGRSTEAVNKLIKRAHKKAIEDENKARKSKKYLQPFLENQHE